MKKKEASNNAATFTDVEWAADNVVNGNNRKCVDDWTNDEESDSMGHSNDGTGETCEDINFIGTCKEKVSQKSRNDATNEYKCKEIKGVLAAEDMCEKKMWQKRNFELIITIPLVF